MWQTWWTKRWWVAGALTLSLAGAWMLARQELQSLQEAFETDARIVHRLLSQRVVQHDAILATLALLPPDRSTTPSGVGPEQSLPALYPQIRSVLRRDLSTPWPDSALTDAEARARSLQRPVLVDADLASGLYRLVVASGASAYAMSLDMRAVVPWEDWPMAVTQSPVNVWLEHAGQRLTLQSARSPVAQGPGGWTHRFRKVLAANSQPFEVVAERHVGWAELPWLSMLGWLLGVWVTMAVAVHLQRQRTGRQRAEDLLRLGQIARLNTMGELAAGMAHEVNQPLTAMLANTQAARRLLDETPPELEAARGAMQRAAEQARRAADVVGRLRRAIEQPERTQPSGPVDLHEAVRRALHLLEPECQRRQVVPRVSVEEPVSIRVDAVAIDQILHNLLMNALQSLEQVPLGQRQLLVSLTSGKGRIQIRVADTGQGMTPETLQRLFQPFFSTRAGGLGLGLSLSATLAEGMGGSLTASAPASGGAEFVLTLPGPEPRP